MSFIREVSWRFLFFPLTRGQIYVSLNIMGVRKQKAGVRRAGLTFVEVMLAFLLLGLVFLPIFMFLTGAVKDTERFYTETIAISRAKFIMDSLMFQVPWRAIREGNPCVFQDPKDKLGVNTLLSRAVPKMFGDGCKTPDPKVFNGDGLYTCRKGFKYRARVKVVDLDYDSTSGNPILFIVPATPPLPPEMSFKDLVAKDADGKYNCMKKIVVQVRWSNSKGVDPNNDNQARDIFLVGFKSDLEG